jgi:hypothetical protein
MGASNMGALSMKRKKQEIWKGRKDRHRNNMNSLCGNANTHSFCTRPAGALKSCVGQLVWSWRLSAGVFPQAGQLATAVAET